MPDLYLGRRRRRGSLLFVVIAALILLISSRYIASTFIDYAWWSEIHQVDTWLNLLVYGTGPIVLAVVIFFIAFWTAYKLGSRGRTGPIFGVFSRSFISKLVLLILAVLAVFAANATVDNWTVVRFFGGQRVPAPQTEFIDPIFGHQLRFYFFGLPFYNMLLNAVLTAVVAGIVIYWISSNVEDLHSQFSDVRSPGAFDIREFRFAPTLNTGFIRITAAVFLIGLALKFFFSRYEMLFEDHGAYLVGVDWLADHVALPLQWLLIVGSLFAAALILARRARFALLLLLLLPVRYIVPSLVAGLYVRPNELALEKPYIQRHIEATRSAYGLNGNVKETALEAQPEIPIDYAKHAALLGNVRLWDWRPFHDTISQIQPLRPYVYIDTDVDRYTIDGKLRQVLIAPRELDIRQLGPAGSRWINPHLIYTHGYGVVMAESNRISPDGLPLLFVKNAPPEITTPTLKLTQPELYYSEVAHEPVLVDTAEREFNYPSGSQSVYTTYKGSGGFSVASPLMRLAAAVDYGDINILITGYLNSNSRMMIRRPILQRLHEIAGFLTWDTDPYLVLSDAGRLVWIIDGYMSSSAHPYSRELDLPEGRTINYIRNSVKATIDAYTGETNLYIFDSSDVLIQAYAKLFPDLFKPVSRMPADLRRHARYPETLFSAQAEIFRTFHMRDAESFYNRADLWDISRTGNRQSETGAASQSPTYVVATLPGSDTPEFMLLTTFTPANKDNLIGVMFARCDGEHLGELVFEQLSKQNIIYGPLQIDARINQDQNISKDLTLWNQQGSQVIRGQTLVLPIDKSFLYVAPIYIQASQASMPQLKKVALAMGNRLSYADTYEQALSGLINAVGGSTAPETPASPPNVTALPTGPTGPTAPPVVPSSGFTPDSAQANQTLRQIRDHLQRYKDLSAQGKWADAGRELDEIQRLVQH